MASTLPAHWFPLGISGDKMLDEIKPFLPPDFEDRVLITRVAFDRSQNKIVPRDDPDLPTIKDASVFIIDGAIHSGNSMRRLADELSARGARSIWSYSLVLRRTSEFIPSFFGLLIDEHDRAFFQLDEIPNNRLFTSASIARNGQFGLLRALREEDVHRTPSTVDVAVRSIAKTTFGDLYYGVRTQGSRVFVYELGGAIVGFITFVPAHKRLFIDTIAIDRKSQSLGIGGLLMRWAETYARSLSCEAIELWAIEDRRDWYRNAGYEFLPGEIMDIGNGERYAKMRRRLLYNIRPTDQMYLN
jgi:GNAT superfamily N-acetyltransferase